MANGIFTARKPLRSRLMALLLVTALLLGALPLSAAAAEPGRFADVSRSSWYYYAVEWAAEQEITSGVGGGRFAPQQELTRGQLVTMLWSMTGRPAAADRQFSDVKPGQWYADAVNWAAEAGVVSGYPGGSFGPGDPATREQVATILYQFAALRQEDRSRTDALTGFRDASAVAAYALPAVRWAVGSGLISGTSETTLSPKATATRAQLVSMLYHWLAEYTLRDVPVYRESLTSTETVALRFYREEPHVPTMGLKDFYNTFWCVKTKLPYMTAEKIGSQTVFTAPTGAQATVDPEDDTVVISAFTAFVTPPAVASPLEEGDNPLPFVLGGQDSVIPEEPVPWAVDLGDYGMDLREAEGDVFFPLDTLSNLFGQDACYYVLYNGKALYVSDEMMNVYESAVGQSAPDYYAFMDKLRSQDEIDHAYQELLFNVEQFYGQPGSEPLHDAVARKKLDQVLREEYPGVVAALLDPDPKEFAAGLFMLFNSLLADGGHTGFYDWDWNGKSYSVQMLDRAQRQGLDYQEKAMSTSTVEMQLSMAREDSLGTDAYVEQGDTAFFTFDGFTLDSLAWRDYYKALSRGETPEFAPTREDTVSEFLTAVRRAQANPDIRNFVVDLTTNGGGVVPVGAFLVDLMTGTNQLNVENLPDGQVASGTFLFDRNFDGVWDEKDEAVRFDLNFAVLISPCSFSCANTVPAMMKDAGVLVLGERSGGGACTVREAAAPGGLAVRMSSPYRACNNAGENIDTGVEPHVSLVKTDSDGEKDYSDFYDLDVLSQAVNAYYAGLAG